MNRAIRLALAIAIAASAAWLVERLCYQRYRCNARKAEARRTLERFLPISEQPSARIAARRAIESMDHCIAHAPTDIAAYMIRAGALRMLGRPAEAVTDYRRALRYDRRPELYLNLGMTELEAGNDAAAVAHISLASLTFRPYFYELPAPLHDRVEAAINPLYSDIQARRVKPEALRDLSHSLSSVGR